METERHQFFECVLPAELWSVLFRDWSLYRLDSTSPLVAHKPLHPLGTIMPLWCVTWGRSHIAFRSTRCEQCTMTVCSASVSLCLRCLRSGSCTPRLVRTCARACVGCTMKSSKRRTSLRWPGFDALARWMHFSANAHRLLYSSCSRP